MSRNVFSKLKHWRHQWRNLEPWEKRMLVQQALSLPCVWLLLRLFSFAKAKRLVEVRKVTIRRKSLPEGLSPLEFAHRSAQLMEIAASHGLYQANCLHQSLALINLLKLAGLPARLRIGVLPNQRPFQAHAWVELDGVPLGEKSVAAYGVFEHPDSFSKTGFGSGASPKG